MSDDGFRPAGTGLTVYEDDEVVEGPVVWLETPAAVIDFVTNGDVEGSIVVARGGTTTFLTPALTAGIKGVMTLQGAPESHLGILSREYGIPCLMSVAFDVGVRTDRGEVVPADGTRVRIDISTSPRGRVLVEEGAEDSTSEPVSADAPQGPSEEELAQVQKLLDRHLGETPRGIEGNAIMRARSRTGVLDTARPSLDGALDREQLNELLDYQGWNFWDFLSARATEGESGLIPRQEYEAVGCVQIWQRYREMIDAITERVGVDGIYELGGLSRREIGTKGNLLHIWSIGAAVAFGRGVQIGLGNIGAEERESDLAAGLQFMRRLYAGAWNDGGGLYASMRGYAAPLLEDHWIERFREEFDPIDDPEKRKVYQRFSAGTELLGFLLHYDNRCGLADTGPYPTGDGGFLIVRDHFLHEPVYHWADVAEDLPYSITQAMFFKPTEPMQTQLMDGSTIFTKPGNYLKHLTGMACYVRDRWDTPVSDVRRLGLDEMGRIESTCRDASTKLYRRIAGMSRRDKVFSGAQVYYTDFILPFARAAGVWDRLVEQLNFFEIDPETSSAYYQLVVDGQAATLVPQLFLGGGGFPPVPSI